MRENRDNRNVCGRLKKRWYNVVQREIKVNGLLEKYARFE